jgi:hypothetical protein
LNLKQPPVTSGSSKRIRNQIRFFEATPRIEELPASSGSLRKIPRTKEPPVIFGSLKKIPETRNPRVIFGSLKKIQNHRTSGYIRFFEEKKSRITEPPVIFGSLKKKNPESQNHRSSSVL